MQLMIVNIVLLFIHTMKHFLTIGDFSTAPIFPMGMFINIYSHFQLLHFSRKEAVWLSPSLRSDTLLNIPQETKYSPHLKMICDPKMLAMLNLRNSDRSLWFEKFSLKFHHYLQPPPPPLVSAPPPKSASWLSRGPKHSLWQTHVKRNRTPVSRASMLTFRHCRDMGQMAGGPAWSQSRGWVMNM